MKKNMQMFEYQLDRLIDTMNKMEKHQGVIAGVLKGSDPYCNSAFDEIRQAIYSLEFVIAISSERLLMNGIMLRTSPYHFF